MIKSLTNIQTAQMLCDELDQYAVCINAQFSTIVSEDMEEDILRYELVEAIPCLNHTRDKDFLKKGRGILLIDDFEEALQVFDSIKTRTENLKLCVLVVGEGTVIYRKSFETKN